MSTGHSIYAPINQRVDVLLDCVTVESRMQKQQCLAGDALLTGHRIAAVIRKETSNIRETPVMIHSEWRHFLYAENGKCGFSQKEASQKYTA